MPKIAFFETNQEDKQYLETKLANKGYSLLFFDQPFKLELLRDNLDLEAVSLFVGSRLTAAETSGLKNLKLITTRSTGFDHIDQTLAEKGIRLGYVPGYGDNTVAEFAFGLLLALVRKIAFANQRIKVEGKFSIEGCDGFDLLGKTIGIIGTGRIGKHMIRIAKGFSMKVIAYDLTPSPDLAKELNFSYLSFDELLANADVISLHVPYFDKTHHLINAAALAKMKPGVVIINTSRGGVIDTHALLASLQNGKVGGFGADVLEGEEHVTDERAFLLYGQKTQEEIRTMAENLVLVDMPNVLLTPHIAFYTKEALHRILDTDLENIVSFFESGRLVYDIMASKRVSGSSPSGEKK